MAAKKADRNERRAPSAEILRALRSFLDELEERPHVEAEAERLWQAVTDIAPDAWRHMPDEIVLSAAAAAQLRDDRRMSTVAQARVVGASALETALSLIEEASRERQGIRNQVEDDSEAVALSTTLGCAWTAHSADRGLDVAKLFRFDLGLRIPRTADRLVGIPDQDLVGMVLLWASKPEGRPRAGESRESKWELLSQQFAQRLGVFVNAESLKKASRSGGLTAPGSLCTHREMLELRVRDGEPDTILPPMWRK